MPPAHTTQTHYGGEANESHDRLTGFMPIRFEYTVNWVWHNQLTRHSGEELAPYSDTGPESRKFSQSRIRPHHTQLVLEKPFMVSSVMPRAGPSRGVSNCRKGAIKYVRPEPVEGPLIPSPVRGRGDKRAPPSKPSPSATPYSQPEDTQE